MPAKDIYHNMDSLTNKYRQIIKKILEEYTDFLGNDEQVTVELVLDEKMIVIY